MKWSDPIYGQGLLEFQIEIMILSKICHLHMVLLIGYCKEGSEMILVYQFMWRGTLRDHFYTSENNGSSCSTGSKMSWKQRFEICIGSAKGLPYLHTGLDSGIILWCQINKHIAQWILLGQSCRFWSLKVRSAWPWSFQHWYQR